MSSKVVYSVSELTQSIKMILEGSFSQQLSIRGELSNFKKHSSGHWYFSLKDEGANISCSMWRSYNAQVRFNPSDGMKVVLDGLVTVYAPKGNYQFDVRGMSADGEGELYKAFLKLKEKLDRAGYFKESRKKPIPAYPSKIGIVTSPTGAALRDMIVCAKRRYPLVELVIMPSRVEGAGACDLIATGIKKLNQYPGVDVIIVARGGGSIEDLWAFNEEVTAKAIYDSAIPVICGVGHETDTTIADFTADLRAATPTAAMELATPNLADGEEYFKNIAFGLGNSVNQSLQKYRLQVSSFGKSYASKIPMNMIRTNAQKLDHLSYKITSALSKIVEKQKTQIELFKVKILSHNIEQVLRKGFVYIRQNGKVVKKSSELVDNELFAINFQDGICEINSKKKI